MNKKRLSIIITLIMIIIISLTIVFTVAYYTDRKQQSVILRSANLDYSITAEVAGSAEFNDYSNDIRQIKFTIVNNSDNDVYSNIGVMSGFMFDKPSYEEDLLFYPSTISDNDIKADISNNSFTQNYSGTSDFGYDTDFGQILVNKGETKTFVVKVANKSNRNFANIAEFQIMASIYTGNGVGGKGFIEHLEDNDTVYLYYFMNTSNVNQGVQTVNKSIDYMVKEYTQSSPLVDLKSDNFNIIEKNRVRYFFDANSLNNYGLTLDTSTGLITGTPSGDLPENCTIKFIYDDTSGWYNRWINASARTDGTYVGSITLNFNRIYNDISGATVGSISEYTYDGNEKKPEPVVTYNGNTLTKGTDYTLSYSNNTNAGTATVIITGTGNFSGSVSKEFTINKANSDVTTAPATNTLTYTGNSQTLVTAGSASNGVMYYRVYQYKSTTASSYTTYNNSWSTTRPTGINAGNYVVQYYVKGNTNYSDTTVSTLNVEIKKADAYFQTKPSAKTLTYTGNSQVLLNTGTSVGGTIYYKLTTDSSYSVSIPSRTNAGAYTVKSYVLGDANHNNSTEVSIDVVINKANSSVTTEPAANDLTYTGNSQTLITDGVANGGRLYYKLVSYTDMSNTQTTYNNSYSTTRPVGTNAGTYVVQYYVLGDSNHNDTSIPAGSTTVTIKKANSNVTSAPEFNSLTYNGNTQTLVTSGSATGGTLQYRLYQYKSMLSSSYTTYSNSWSTTRPTGIDAGYYVVQYYVAGNNNYNDTDVVTLTSSSANIARASFTATVNISNYTYAGNKSAPLVSNNPEGGSVTYYGRATSGGTATNWNSVTNTTYDAGTRYCYAVIAATNNYNSCTTSNTSFTIYKANQSAPTSFTATPATLTSVSFSASGGGGQGSLQYSKDGTNWYTSSSMSGLIEDTTYTFYVRWSGNNNYNVSSTRTTTATPSYYTWSGNTVTGLSELGKNLTSIHIPDRATAIGNNAFKNNTKITKITNLGNNVTTIGEHAFDFCCNITGNLTIPNSVTTIGDGAFYRCIGFTGDLIIPNSVTSIGKYAFYNCLGFNGNLTISNSVTTISKGAFKDCTGLTGNLTIPDSVTTIGYSAFSYCIGFNGNLIIPDSVTTIDNYAFCDCYGLTGNLTIPNSIATINDYAFYNCKGFTGNLVIPNSVTSIGSYSFGGCSKLETINVPESVTSIDTNAFKDCSNLRTIYVNQYESSSPLASNKPWGASSSVQIIWKNMLEDMFTWNGNIITGIASNYVDTMTDLNIPDRATAIADGAFYYNKHNLTSISNLGKNVTSIGNNAFFFSQNITGDVHIPEGCVTIGNQAFRACYGIENIYVPESVTSIGTDAFAQTRGLTHIYIDKYRDTIAGEPWGGYETTYVIWKDYIPYDDLFTWDGTTITGLTESGRRYVRDLSIPDNATAIADNAFKNETKLQSLVSLGANVTSIGNYAFYGCRLRGELALPPNLTKIGDYAFDGNDPLTGNLDFSNTLTYIGDYAFRNCWYLTGNLIIPDSVTYLGSGAFAGDRLLAGQFKLSSNITGIRDYTFSGCEGLSQDIEYKIPSNITYIGDSAFENISMKAYYIPETVKSIGEYAFYSDDGVEYIYVDHDCYDISGTPWGNQEGKANVIWRGYYTWSGTTITGLTETGKRDMQRLYIPDECTAIGSHAFDGVVTSNPIGVLNFGRNVTSIGDYAFRNCGVNNSFVAVNVSLPPKLEYVGDYAFGNTRFVGSLTIPDTVTSIGNYAFADSYCFTGDLTITSNVSYLGQYAFSGCSGLSGTLSFNTNLSEIPMGLFSDCRNLKGTLTIPSSVTHIDAYAFRNCSNLSGTFTLPSSVVSIGDYAFSGTGISGTLTLHNNASFGSGVFANCIKLTGSPPIPTNWSLIPSFLYEGCSGFNGTLTIPSNIRSIGEAAFRNCTGLTGNLTIPDTVTNLGERSFDGCRGFNGSLYISKNVTSIPYAAFYNVCNLTGTLTIPEGVTYIGENAFQYSGFSGTVTLPSTIEIIDRYAFMIMPNMVRIDIPAATTTIGSYAFMSCNNLTDIYIAKNKGTISGSSWGAPDDTVVHWLDYDEMKQQNQSAPISVTAVINGTTATVTASGGTAAGTTYYSKDNNNWQTSNVFTGLTMGSSYYFYAKYGETTAYKESSSTQSSSYYIKRNQSAPSVTASLTSLTSVTVSSSSSGYGTLQFSRDGSTWYNASNGSYTFTGLTPDTIYTFYARYLGNASYNASSTRTTAATPSYYTWSGNTVTGLSTLGSNLTDINIPDRATAIGNNAFQNNTKITKITSLGNNVTSIGDWAFNNCSGLTGNLTIPNSVNSVGNGAFNNCRGFNGNLTIPNSVTSIGGSAFEGCSNLTGNLTIPNSVTSIGNYAFEGCTGFTGNLIIPNSVTTIGDYAFSYCIGFNGNLIIPNSVTTIGDYAFCDCYGLTGNLIIPNSITTIGDYAFYNCLSLTGNLTIPNSVTTIGVYAFKYCSKLETINVPESVTSIDTNAFKDCSNLRTIYIDKTEGSISGSPWGASSSTKVIWKDTAADMFTWSGTTITGLSSSYSSVNVDLNIPDKATAIKANAFQNKTNIKSILNLGANVTSIGNQAFDGCTGITGNLTIPNKVTSVGSYAFRNCGFTGGKLILSSKMTAINTRSFSGTKFSGTVTIPKGVTSIGTYAFYDSTIVGFEVPSTVTSIARTSFGNNSALKAIYIDQTSSSSLHSSTNFTSSKFGANSDAEIIWKDDYNWGNDYTIGPTNSSRMYAMNRALKYIYIPSRVTQIGYEAFDRDAGSSAGIANSCIYGIVNIGDNVQTIGQYAFWNATNITGRIEIPSTVTSIGTSAFSGCKPTEFVVHNTIYAISGSPWGLSADYQKNISYTVGTVKLFEDDDFDEASYMIDIYLQRIQDMLNEGYDAIPVYIFETLESYGYDTTELRLTIPVDEVDNLKITHDKTDTLHILQDASDVHSSKSSSGGGKRSKYNLITEFPTRPDSKSSGDESASNSDNNVNQDADISKSSSNDASVKSNSDNVSSDSSLNTDKQSDEKEKRDNSLIGEEKQYDIVLK